MARATEATEERRFTLAEYHRMADAGIFKPGERIELIRGVVRVERELVVFRSPRDDGYRDQATYRPGDRVTMEAWPDVSIEVSSLFVDSSAKASFSTPRSYPMLEEEPSGRSQTPETSLDEHRRRAPARRLTREDSIVSLRHE